MLFFARGNFLLDNMAVKKNARREIAAPINKTAGSWEDTGNCRNGKTAAGFINKNPRRKAWVTVFR